MYNGSSVPIPSAYVMPDERAILAKAEQTLIGLLQHCDRIQLQEFHDKDQKLDEMIAANVLDDALRDLRAQKDSLLAQTRQLAEANLSKQQPLAQAKQRLAAIYDEAKREREQYQVNKVRVESLSSNTQLDNVLALLNVAARQAEDESEKLAEQLTAKQITVQQFLDEFVEKRKLAYLRKIKADKLQELITRPQPAAPPSASAAVPMRPPPPAINVFRH